MERKTVSTTLVLILLTATFSSTFISTNILCAETQHTWVVDDNSPADFSAIQDAINAANNGDTILVRNGTYRYSTVNKTLSLIGESPQNTIIQGNTSISLNIIANNSYVTGFTMFGASSFGVQIDANNCTLNKCIIKNNYDGVMIRKSDNKITNNVVFDNHNRGICLDAALSAYVANNSLPRGQGLTIDVRYSNNSVITRNDVYFDDVHASFLILLLASSSNIISENNLVSGADVPAAIIACVDGSNYNEISRNNIQGKKGVTNIGIALQSVVIPTTNEYVTENNITDCWSGIDVTSNNFVARNTITNSLYGIRLLDAINNTIMENDINGNVYGIDYVGEYTSNNRIYHNNFEANDVIGAIGNNTWDDGYPSGGNYWSDYEGTDNNHDNIGDTPYVINSGNRDNYPLMHPYERIDFNRDGLLNSADLNTYIKAFVDFAWGRTFNSACDLNHDGTINFQDTMLFMGDCLAYWQKHPI